MKLQVIKTIGCFLLFVLYSFTVKAQNLPSRWDELTASDWQTALDKSSQTCILPIGILEKHGPQDPIGADLIHVREWVAKATKKEYAVVFPDYFYGQINEARHQYGTFALPSRLVMELLDSTCAEIGRNGFKKIVIVNGHGGNPDLLRYFVQTQLERRHSYAVFFYDPAPDADLNAKVSKLRKSDAAGDMHAGERETSVLMYYRPDLIKLDRGTQESGANQKRLDIPNAYTAIWWYADFPNHYAGEGAKATKELGQLIAEREIETLAKTLKSIKEDTKTLQLQNEFYDKVKGSAKPF